MHVHMAHSEAAAKGSKLNIRPSPEPTPTGTCPPASKPTSQTHRSSLSVHRAAPGLSYEQKTSQQWHPPAFRPASPVR